MPTEPNDEWIGFDECPHPRCCMIRDHGGDHWPGDPLDPALAKLLGEHSPRLIITRPSLVPSATSPTGWLLVVPDAGDSRLALAVIEAVRGVVAEWTIRGDGGCDTVRRQRLIDALTAYEDQRTDA